MLVKHLWQLILFLIVLGGPLPLCGCIAIANVKERKRYSIAHSLLVIITAWSIIEVCLGTLLGIINQLNIWALIISEIVIFTIGLVSFLRLTPATAPFSFRNLIIPNRRLNKQELLVIGAISFVGFVILERLATIPIADGDSLWFHLPAMARWYQTHSFTFLDPAGHWLFNHPDATKYPYNWEVLCTLFLIPFQEDFLVTFPMLIGWVMIGLSVYLLSHKFGATRLHSMAGSSLVLTIPYLINQINTLHIDLPLASVFMVGLYLAFSYNTTGAMTELALFLASLGMLAGIKIPGVVYGVFLVGVLAILEIIKLCKGKSNKSRWSLSKFVNSAIAAGILALLLLGGYWYVRNSIEIKNYIGYFGEVQVASTNVTMLPAVFNSFSELQKSTLTNQFNPTNIFHWKTLGIQAITRLQIPFIAMLLQVLVACAFRSGQRKISNETLIYVIALTISTGFLYWNTPYSSGTGGESSGRLSPLLGYNMRYGFPFLSVLGIAAAVSATLIRTRDEIIVATILISSIAGIVSNTIFDISRNQIFIGKNPTLWPSRLLNNFTTSPGETIDFIFSTLKNNMLDIFIYITLYILLMMLLVWRLFGNSWNPSRAVSRFFSGSGRRIIICIAIAAIVTATFAAREKRDLYRSEIYGGVYEYMEDNLAKNEKIGHLSSASSYLFYGKNLNREVLNVPLKSGQFSQWLDNLRQQEIGVVAVGPMRSPQRSGDWWKSRKEFWWLESADAPFIRVFGQDVGKETVLYRLKS